MYQEIYEAVEKIFRGPVIMHHNNSISGPLKKFMESFYEIETDGKCYMERVGDDLILMTYNDTIRNVGVIFDQCYMEGKLVKIIGLPLMQCIEEATAEYVMTYIALTVIAAVASINVNDGKTANTFPLYDGTNFANGISIIYCHAPMVIYCSIIRDIFHNMFSLETVFQQFQYVVKIFFEIDPETNNIPILYGHNMRCFSQNWAKARLRFADIYNLITSYYENASKQTDNIRFGRFPSFVYEYLDCSLLLSRRRELLDENNDIYELDDPNITDPVILHKNIDFDKQESNNNKEDEDIEEGFVYEEEEEEK